MECSEATLIAAAEVGNASRARLVLACRSAAEQHDDGRALVLAASRGHVDVVRVLLPHASPDEVLTALATASCAEVIDALWSAYPDRLRERALPQIIKNAIATKATEVLRFLVPRLPDHRARNSLLKVAAANDNVDALQMLLAPGLDVSAALAVSARQGFFGATQALLQAGADPSEGLRAVFLPAFKSPKNPMPEAKVRREVLLLLLGAGARPSSTAMDYARKDAELLRLFLAAGGGKASKQAVISSAREGRVDALEMLLAGGGRATTEALYSAARGDHVEAMKMLLAAGAEARGEVFRLPSAGAARLLISAGAKVGGLALISAAASGDVELVKVLLGAGAAKKVKHLDVAVSDEMGGLLAAAGVSAGRVTAAHSAEADTAKPKHCCVQ